MSSDGLFGLNDCSYFRDRIIIVINPVVDDGQIRFKIMWKKLRSITKVKDCDRDEKSELAANEVQ